MAGPGRDNRQVDTTEFLHHLFEECCSVAIRHVEGSDDRPWRERLSKSLESFEPPGQEPASVQSLTR